MFTVLLCLLTNLALFRIDANLKKSQAKLKVSRPKETDDSWLNSFVAWAKKELDCKMAALWKVCSDRRFIISLLHKYSGYFYYFMSYCILLRSTLNFCHRRLD